MRLEDDEEFFQSACAVSDREKRLSLGCARQSCACLPFSCIHSWSIAAASCVQSTESRYRRTAGRLAHLSFLRSSLRLIQEPVGIEKAAALTFIQGLTTILQMNYETRLTEN